MKNLPAIATLTGLSETALARLERANIDEDGMARFGDIVRFTGYDASDLLPYIESGVALTSIQAAAQIQSLSTAADGSGLGALIDLAHSIGPTFDQDLPPGMTLYHGQIMTAQEAQRRDLEGLQRRFKAAGVGSAAPTGTVDAAALMGGTATATADGSQTAAETEPTPVEAAAIYEAFTPQEKIMADLLDVADSVTYIGGAELLNRLIAERYDGNVRAVFHLLSQDEEEFKRQLAGVGGPSHHDRLLDPPKKRSGFDGEPDSIGRRDSEISLDDYQREENDDEEEE